MKAIKINKIVWDLNNVNEDKKDEILKNLPVAKAFMTNDDNFNVTDKVPSILKKKYGYDIKTFTVTECRVVDTVDDLLKLSLNSGEKVKKLYKVSGSLSSFGMELLNRLETNIKGRLNLEKKGVNEYDMPKIYDETMIGFENVTGMKWEGLTVQEIMNAIMEKIWKKEFTNLKDDVDEEDIDDETDEYGMTKSDYEEECEEYESEYEEEYED